jgi:ABC-type antimicrobial peptide transport system permease subunit
MQPNQNSPYQMMLRSYLTAGYRNAMRNGATSLINVLGLSVGVATAVTAFIFMDFMWNVDDFHVNKDRVYEVIAVAREEGRTVLWGDSPRMLGPSVFEDNPAVEAVSRVKHGRASVRYGDIVFAEPLWFVDQSFPSVFSFPLMSGSSSALKDKNVISISDQVAEKYFGTTAAVGQVMSMKFPDGSKHDFTVGSVLQIPQNSGMHFGILVSMDKLDELEPATAGNWKVLVDATFIMMHPGHTSAELRGFDKYADRYNSTSSTSLIESFQFVPLATLSSRSNDISGPISFGAHPRGVWSLGAIALMLLLLACFNYMNVAVATVSTRLKEIGIRKVIGSKRKEIIQQFITENILISAFALAMGTLISYVLLLPGINSLFPFEIPFGLSSGNTALLFFFGLLIFIALVSGTYPAVYVSSFKPITILRGREKFGQRGLFSRVLLTVQFVLAFTLIVGSFVFIDNAQFQQHKDWGYGHDHQLVVPVLDKPQYLAMRDKVASSQLFEAYAGSGNAVGYDEKSVFIEDMQKRKFEAVEFVAGENYMETMNFRLKEGRFFDKNIESDKTESVIVNEIFARRMNWTNPLRESVEIDSVRYYVIGVVKDFHYQGFYNVTLPVLFRMTAEDNYRYLSVRARPGREEEASAFLSESWKAVAPDDPYNGYAQNSVFEDFDRDNNANIKLLIFFSSTAILLACLGLFGLVSYNITRRLKEFSIRKVFGANVFHIFRLMNRDYIVILGVAFAFGAPAGFFLINLLIQQIYPEPQVPNAFPFVTAVVLMAVTVGLTIGSQLRRVLKENPTTTLKVD